MNIIIKDFPLQDRAEAVDIFSEAFADDDLFVLAFPDGNDRKRLTKIMYEFVVYDMVPGLELKLKGAYNETELIGCIIYTTPKSKPWDEKMMNSVKRMREKGKHPGLNMIGEFAMMEGFDPKVPYCYGNELAVRKEYRKKGIAHKLIEEMINDCRKFSGVKGIMIDTANANNLPLYNKLGWELKETLDFYDIKKYFLWKEI